MTFWEISLKDFQISINYNNINIIFSCSIVAKFDLCNFFFFLQIIVFIDFFPQTRHICCARNKIIILQVAETQNLFFHLGLASHPRGSPCFVPPGPLYEPHKEKEFKDGCMF